MEDEVADARLQLVLARQQEIQRQLNVALEGSVREVLVTGLGKTPGTLSGRTTCHRIVHFPVEEVVAPIGTIANVRIERALPHSLVGALV